jgi:uncharacterized protein YjcR
MNKNEKGFYVNTNTVVKDWDKYKRLYENDPFMKYVDVASMTGVSRQRVDQIAKRDNWGKIVTKEAVIEKKIINYVNQLNAMGRFSTHKKIAKAVGFSIDYVRAAFKENKLHITAENPFYIRKRKPHSEKKFERFKQLRNEGMTLKEISEIIGVNCDTVCNWNTDYFSKKVVTDPIPRDLAFEKFKELNAQGYYAKDISETVGVPRNTIYKWRERLAKSAQSMHSPVLTTTNTIEGEVS